jgi:hypothetical protein
MAAFRGVMKLAKAVNHAVCLISISVASFPYIQIIPSTLL